MALPVNFKDDVLASSMDGKRRYNMITNSDGTVSFEDVTTYSQEGSNFGSAQINNTNGAINTINNNVLDTIEQISANTSSGKFAGALALKNVNNSFQASINKELDYHNKKSLLSYNSSNKYYTVTKGGIVIIESNFTQSAQRVVLYDKKYSTTEYIAFCDGNGANTGTVSMEVYKGQELYIETSPQGAKRFDFTPFK